MSLQTFFDDFALLADAPNGVVKLRGLILQLAVQGKLVPQNEQAEPPSILLARIKAEKARLVKEKKIRQTDSPPVNDDEAPYGLPLGWMWSRLGIAGLINPRNDFDDDKPASFVPMTFVPQIYGEQVRTETRQWSEIKKGFTHFAEGDVVLAKITPCFQNGKAAVVRGLENGIGAGTTELHVFRPLGGLISSEYVLIYLKSPKFLLDGIPRMTGTAGQKRVPNDYFSENPFPLPPLEEQKRIVAKVDELMRLCDELEARQQATRESRVRLNSATLAPLNNAASLAPEEFEQASVRLAENFATLYYSAETVGKLRSAILQLAVQGKLIPQEPNDEPASMLLKKIAEEKARLLSEEKIRKIESHPAAANDAAPFMLPDGWTWSNGGELSTFVTSGSRGWATYYSKTGAIFLRIGNLDYNSISLDLTSIQCVSPPPGAEGNRTQVQGKDILISITGDTGMIGLVPDNFPEAYINQHIALFRPSENVCAEYLARFFTSPLAFFQLQGAQRGIKNSLGLNDIKFIMLPLPPLEEQKRIVAKVNQLMALCDELETKLRQAEPDSEKLMNAAVQHVLAAISERSTGILAGASA